MDRPWRHLDGRRFRRLLVPLLVTLAAAGGCSRPAPPAGPPLGITERLLPEADRLLLPTAGEAAEVPRWRFEGPEDLEGWQFPLIQGSGTEGPRVEAGALNLTLGNRGARMVRGVRLAAAGIRRLEVVVEAEPRGPVTLFWAGAGERFSAQRRLRLPSRRSGPLETYRFELADHPEWSGTIRRLRLDFSGPRGHVLKVRSIEAVDTRPRGAAEASQLAAAAGAEPEAEPERSFKIDLGHDLRTGLPAPPGSRIVREIEVGDGQILELSYGLQPGVEAPVRFTVRIDIGGDDETLFEARLVPAQSYRWWDSEVDLSRFAGRRVRLRFETAAEGGTGGEAAGGSDPSRGLPVWGALTALRPAGSGGPPNIVLISVDTLRADHLSLYGYPQPTTPHIDAWAHRRGVTFLETVAAAPWTLPSHISLFTGLDALSHGMNHELPAAPSLHMLAEILRDRGYATQAMTGGGYLAPEFGLHQGFDRFVYWPSDRSQRQEIEALTEQALAWLSSVRHRPFFLFFHTYEVHMPYRRSSVADALLWAGRRLDVHPEPSAENGYQGVRRLALRNPLTDHREPLPPEDLPDVRHLYDNGVTNMDRHIGRLLDALGELGLERSTLVVLTSDHGEMLGEHGLGGHAFLYDANLRVPLVVALPDGRGAGRTVAHQVRSIDILPTVLEAAGFEPPSGLDGESLLPLVAGDAAGPPRPAWSYAASTNYGLSLRLSNRLKYVFNNTAWGPLLGREELYRLREDPAEETNLAGRAPGDPELPRLRARARERFEGSYGGVAARFDNASAQPFEATLAAPGALTTMKIKCLDTAEPRPTFRWHRGGELHVTAPPGSSFTVYLEDLGATALRLTLQSGAGTGGTPFTSQLQLPYAPGSFRLGLADGRWRELADADEPWSGTGITLLGTDTAAAAAASADQLRPELVEQLRALGYVN